MINKKKLIVGVLLFCMATVSVNDSTLSLAAQEREPNGSFSNAQSVVLGERYSGVVKGIDFSDDGNDDEDEDYYKISVKEGNMYRIVIDEFKDEDGGDPGTTLVSLCKDTNTGDESSLRPEKGKSARLFKASYSGAYYLKFYNAISDTLYSFTVENYDPVGKSVKDSDSNTYKITGKNSIELTKAASKKGDSLYLSEEEYFTDIGGIELIDPYDSKFKLTSIGKYACKGCGVKSISFPETVKKIGVGAFQNCKKLGTEKWIMGVVISGKKVVIEKDAFKGCSKLDTFRVFKSASIKSVGKNALKGTKKGIRLEVPGVNKYKKIFKKAGLKNPQFSKAYI